ncbi:MAG: DUF5752 family protein [Thermodesulfobacteriota bacterium]
MKSLSQKPARDPFIFRECFLMPMPLGHKVVNLRELLLALQEVKESVLFYHLFQSRLALTLPKVEYPNEFALWAATALQDIKLAEKLSSFDPFDYETLEEVRQAMVDALEEYMWDLPYVPWARPGFEFHFCEASTVVLRSEIVAKTLREFSEALKKVGMDSLYYHFFEARWRPEFGRVDDFSFWIDSNFKLPELVAAIRDIDIYFYNLTELRDTLLVLIHQHLGEPGGRTE